MQLTPHFSLYELTRSDTATYKGIDNTPSLEVHKNLIVLATVLEQVRAIAGRPINISSGYRSPALNKAVGGSATSAHLTGLAADISCSALKPKELAILIRDSKIVFDQLILEYDRWVHIGLSSKSPRQQVLTIRNGTGYVKGIV